MLRILWLSVLVAGLASPVHASSIAPIAPDKLDERTKVILLGEVVKATPTHKGMQDVRVKVVRVLRGKAPPEVTISVWYEGVKDFDPKLHRGEVGVFYLDEVGSDGKVRFAYRGSVAVFAKGQFKTR